MDQHVAIGTLMVRYTMAYADTVTAQAIRGAQRYVTISLTSEPERSLQQVLTTCVDGYDTRRFPFIGTVRLEDDGLWKTLC